MLQNSYICIQHGTVKVDAARKRGGTKIVWLSWFTDSIALWHRQDETPYLLDDPSLCPAQPGSSPTTDSYAIPSDPEPDNGDWDEDTSAVGKATGGQEFDLGGIDWNDVNDEVDAAMNESDDDDDSKSDKSGMRSQNASDDEGSGTDGSHSEIRFFFLFLIGYLLSLMVLHQFLFPVHRVRHQKRGNDYVA
jgi:RNA polymerase II subunit A C-terminal domain phosphatase